MKRPLIGAAVILLCAEVPAFAQARNPFSVGISEGGGRATGVTGWLLAQQGWFEHQLAMLVRAAKMDGSAFWSLVGLSLLYGIFHAAGPGHGKVVLTSYMVANERALRRGIVLSFLAALFQGLVAILLVGVLALLLHATAERMRDAAALTEIANFTAIAGLGAWLVWRKGRIFWALCRRAHDNLAQEMPFVPSGAGLRLRQADGVAGALDKWAGASNGMMADSPAVSLSYSASSRSAQHGSMARGPGKFVCVADDASRAPDCPHCLNVNPATLGATTLSMREAALTVLAAGSRPCSGAILVLVFALAQGLFQTGMAAVFAMSFGVAVTTASIASIAVLAKGAAQWMTRASSSNGVFVMSGVEFLAALLVLLAGVSLLLGSSSMGGA